MTDQDKTQIYDEMIGGTEIFCDNLINQITSFRKSQIGKLQALRYEEEQDDVAEAIEQADKANENFEAKLKETQDVINRLKKYL